ncbi:MAG: hypothetical protein L0196_07945 [candidate division Zixibacteria bacterium]|nr:hypothetical protein [candidate division Zixibacteria bacterium]
MSKKPKVEYWPHLPEYPAEEAPEPDWKVDRAVRWGLRQLSFMEEEVVERYHLCGQPAAKIAAELGLSEHQVHPVLKGAIRKLKKLLGRFVQKRYGIPMKATPCRICDSKEKKSIEELLKTKKEEETWKNVLRKLREDFQMRTSPRTLTLHLKKHRPRPRRPVKRRPAGKKSGATTP